MVALFCAGRLSRDGEYRRLQSQTSELEAFAVDVMGLELYSDREAEAVWAVATRLDQGGGAAGGGHRVDIQSRGRRLVIAPIAFEDLCGQLRLDPQRLVLVTRWVPSDPALTDVYHYLVSPSYLLRLDMCGDRVVGLTLSEGENRLAGYLHDLRETHRRYHRSHRFGPTAERIPH